MPLPKLQVQGMNRVYTADSGEQKTYSGGVTPEESSYASTGSTSPQTTQVTRYPTSSSSTGSAGVTAAQNAYGESVKPESDASIEARIQSEYSGELAAIRSKYADITAQHLTSDKAQEGRTRANASAEGTLGGDFGNAEQSTAERATADDIASVKAQQAAEEAGVGTAVRTATEAERQAQKGTYQQSLKENVGTAQQKVKDTQSMIQQVAAATDLNSLDQKEYDTLYANSGFDTPELFNKFYEASHQAAIAGTKLLGDATTGYYVPQVGPDGQLSYKNVIPAIVKPTQYGAYTFDANTGEVKTIAPAQPKIVSSGGRLWSVDPKTNEAKALTSATAASGGKVGWQAANTDQHLAVVSYAENQANAYNKKYGTSYTPQQIISAAQSNPDAFLTVLNLAAGSGIYNPASVYVDPASQDTSTMDAATQAAQDAADNANNGG